MRLSRLLQDCLGQLPHQGHRVIGLTLEGDRLQAVLVRQGRGALQVEKTLSVVLSQGSLSEKASFISNIFSREGWQADETILTFPLRLAIVKPLRLPATEPQEIMEMIQLQAPRYVPLAAEEITIGYRLLERSQDGYSRLHMILARRSDIEALLALVQAAGIQPSRLILDALASLPLIKDPARLEGLSLAVDLHIQGATLGIFQKDRLELMRSITLPLLDASGVAWAQVFQEEVRKTLLSVAGDAIPSSFSAYVAGEDRCRGVAQDILEREWKCQVNAVTVMDRVSLQHAGSAGTLNSAWPALGAAMSQSHSDQDSPNLLPEGAGVEHHHLRRVLAGSAVCAALFCGLLAGLYGQSIHSKKQVLAHLTEACARIGPQVQDVKRMEREMDAAAAPLGADGSLVSVMAEFNRLVPGRVALQSLEFEEGETAIVQGTCFSLSDAVGLVEVLQKSPLFAGVELRSSNRRRLYEKDVVDFTVSCRMASGRGRKGGRRHV